MKGILVAMLMCSVALAGCSDPPAKQEEECKDQALCNPSAYLEDHYCTTNDVRPRVFAPDADGPDSDPDPWTFGDFWTYRLTVDGEDLGATKLAYYDLQDNGQHYMVGTPTRDDALQHAVFSVNPVIGRVHKTLYSPHEQGEHADMFFFPLCQGSTWKTMFFGTEFSMAAKHTGVNIPGGSDPMGFTIDGTAADGSKITITYSPMVGWFTKIDLRRTSGENVKLDLTAYGSGYKGQAYFLRGQKDVQHDVALGATGVDRANGAEGAYDTVGLAMDVGRSGSGKLEVHVRNPAGDSVACVGFAGSGIGATTECPAGPLLVEAPFQAGEWSITVETSPLTGQASATGDVTLVSIYDRSGAV